ncbi:MAG: hypothetical protein JWN03_6672 [Nocardia sp.]|uniref:hypothetical protein n=1 Tax=Nocardia sp. TaxID=1821 RepID=UPI002609AA15|nr:hypothetical protein [Nocardia sp.]MCU1646397.1 hypothetical protein [Nocardia sp.]
MDHNIKVLIALALTGGVVLAATVMLRAEVVYCLYILRTDWRRRRYLTAAERTELRAQSRAWHYVPDGETEQRVLRERDIKRSKFRSDLLIGAQAGISDQVELMELTATELVAEYRQAIIWRRMAETAGSAVTGPCGIADLAMVRQWREQTEALDAEYDRRISDPARRGLSWRARVVLRRARFEFGDWQAQQLPLPLHSIRDRVALLASFPGPDDPEIAAFLSGIESTEE